jgi:coenzyme F420-reducing hydrogenase beta subunit
MKMSKWVPTTNLMMLRRMGKLQEEMHELGEVAARCIIQGIDEIDPGSGKVNRERLWREVADVYAQLDETVARLGLSVADIETRRAEKRGYMQEWEAMFEPSNTP